MKRLGDASARKDEGSKGIGATPAINTSPARTGTPPVARDSTPDERVNLASLPHAGRSFSKRQQPERALHKSVAEFLDAALPPDAFWWPTPNGSKRSMVQAANMKRAREMKPGLPDIFVLYRGRLIGLELKSKKGRLKEAQVITCIALTVAGAVYHVIRSVEQVHELLSQIMPLRGRLT